MPFYRSFQNNEPQKTTSAKTSVIHEKQNTPPIEPTIPVQMIPPVRTELPEENRLQGIPQTISLTPEQVQPPNRVQLQQQAQSPQSELSPSREMPPQQEPAQAETVVQEQPPVQAQTQMPVQTEPTVFPADMSTAYFGGLRVSVGNIADNFPIDNATIQISETIGNTTTLIDEINTSATGQTNTIELPAPPLEYSEEAGNPRPYAEYNLTIRAEGFEPVQIVGTEVLPNVVALQRVQMLPLEPTETRTAETFVIPDHTLYGIYPPKIVEEEVKEITGSGEIVLSQVVIPEFIVVHDGAPNNASAQNYYVRYRDYIKNVASSEIYATWPEATIYANILAIQSFTLNRVYTEWYRNKGYNFTITSSTAYDHKWIPERNIFDTINTAVDNIFNNYLSRPNVRQPILTQYCDGKRVTCPGLMSQWGSKYLGDQGYSAIEILRNYYGNTIYINTTEEISGVPSSFPGEALSEGSRGEAVRQMQEQLNAIADIYYPIPNIAADGIYGPRTAEAVRAFQQQFDLTPNGIVDFTTWYKISEIYVAVTRIAEYTR